VSANVKVAAVILDSEVFFSIDPTSSPELRAAVQRKNELTYNLTRELYPDPSQTTITYYGRGTALWTPNQPDKTPPPNCPNLTLPDVGCTQCYCEGLLKGCDQLPTGWCLNQNTRYKPIFSFTERFDASSPFSTSLYEVAEPKLMQEQFAYTAALAKANGVTQGAVWPFVALGTGYRRCIKSAPNAGQTEVDLQCTHPVSSHFLGDYAVFDMTCESLSPQCLRACVPMHLCCCHQDGHHLCCASVGA
jgi:hypothetical protein